MIVKNNKVIIKNALNNKELDYIKSVYKGYDMPWSYNDGVSRIDDDDFQFVVPVWETMHINHMAFDAAASILNILQPEYLLRIKANLRTNTTVIQEAGLHTDTDIPGSLTAIFYVNTCDGYTKFNDGDKIDSIENTLVVFPAKLLHCGTTCTNTNRRVVINFNYIPNINNNIWKLLMSSEDIKYQKFWNSDKGVI